MAESKIKKYSPVVSVIPKALDANVETIIELNTPAGCQYSVLSGIAETYGSNSFNVQILGLRLNATYGYLEKIKVKSSIAQTINVIYLSFPA